MLQLDFLVAVGIREDDPIASEDFRDGNNRGSAVLAVFTISAVLTGFTVFSGLTRGRRIRCQVLLDNALHFCSIHAGSAAILQRLIDGGHKIRSIRVQIGKVADPGSCLGIHDFILNSIQSQGFHLCHAFTSFNR